MRGMLSPSLMCADALNLQTELETLESLGVPFIHLDFMDNHFVPNITLDTALIRKVKTVLHGMRRDIHIMAYKPEQYFEPMDIGEGAIVDVHFEAHDELHATVAAVRERGASPFIAISPDTEPEVLKDYLDEIDGVLVMTVCPGCAGRPMVEGSFEKIAAVRSLIDAHRPGLLLEVDGHVSWDFCKTMRERGGDMFVAGSSSIYQKGLDIKEAVARMNELIK